MLLLPTDHEGGFILQNGVSRAKWQPGSVRLSFDSADTVRFMGSEKKH